MVIMIDIDGTLWPGEDPEPLGDPFPGAVESVNKMAADGHVIVIWTGRGWNQYRSTRAWLEEHGFRFNELLMGKPVANLIIDDRSRRFEGWGKDYTSTIVQ